MENIKKEHVKNPENKKLMGAVVCSRDKRKILVEKLTALAVYLEQNQADGLFVMDCAPASDGQEETLIMALKAVSAAADLPLSVMQGYRRFEDVKKIIYAGAQIAVMPYNGTECERTVFEAAARFDGQVAIYIDTDRLPSDDAWRRIRENGITEAYMPAETFEQCKKRLAECGISAVIADHFGQASDTALKENDEINKLRAVDEINTLMAADGTDNRDGNTEALMAQTEKLLKNDQVSGIADFGAISDGICDVTVLKAFLKAKGIDVRTFESSLKFSDFKLNSDDLIPVIVQDYKSGKVLMLAYMNEASFEETLRSGRMTYFSRSRQELWKKGETSGHYQFVKSIDIDCDRDTMLAKVSQIGAACHTGHESCFYTNLVKNEYDDVNPLTIFDEIMATILERKAHPKEGSYTNYLFDKGVDKILKKVGEEATEIVIAAKNPGAEELKYEICDFLYHMMVLMADRGVTWKEITKELATRH